MNIAGNSVGIDYHQGKIQACIMSSFGKVLENKVCANDVEELHSAISEYGAVYRIAAEACSGAADFLDELSQRYGYAVTLGHPGFISRMKHNPDKSDKTDGELLADLSRVGYLPEVWLAPEEIRDLRSLIRYRFGVVKGIRNYKLQIRALLREQRIMVPEKLNVWTKKGMLWLGAQLEQTFSPHRRWVCEQLLEDLRNQSSRLKLTEAKIASIAKKDSITTALMKEKGVGLITATTLRAEVGWVSRFSNGKQLARFCGLTPRNTSSGTKETCAGIIRAGSPLLRTCLIEVAHHLGKHHPRWKAYKEQLIARGKKRSVAIVAVANRFVRQWFYILKELEYSHAAIN
jgi:transposase